MGQDNRHASRPVSRSQRPSDVIVTGEAIADTNDGERSATDDLILENRNTSSRQRQTDRLRGGPMVVVAQDCDDTQWRVQT